jgi:ABC-type transporter Mla subunit MlaD
VDCDPGTAPGKLANGATIPIDHTKTTVAPDLVNDILRLPYRERLRLIINELGAGVGGRADELNAALRRASPALRETDKVLKILADQNHVIADLVKNGDQVIGDLAGNKEDVSRWIKEAGETATISATRKRQIAAGLHRLPEFLQQLRPTMAALGQAADAQRPGLANLDAASGQLNTFFTRLVPFSKATQANIESLGKAARFGKTAVKNAQSTVAEINKFAAGAPELTKNFDIVLKHLDDRQYAVEADPDSPGGKGYTGLEALLQWLYDQTMAINIYDQNGYILKVNAFVGKCRDYENADSVKTKLQTDPNFLNDCLAKLGPYQPGLTDPDPTAVKTTRKADRKHKSADKQAATTPTGDQPATADKPAVDLPGTIKDLVGNLPQIPTTLQPPDVKGIVNGVGGLGKTVTGGKGTDKGAAADDLLNFLFGR